MIDPHETLLVWLMADVELGRLVSHRIAAKHRFGADAPDVSWALWPLGEPALGVYLDGGMPDIYTPVQEIRVECRCYGDTQYNAMRIWRRLQEMTRTTGREVVATSEGQALLHNFLTASGPSLLWDDVLHMDVCVGFFTAMVGEIAAA